VSADAHAADAGAPTRDATQDAGRDDARACEPSVFVIFGVTGDLARRKILPALWANHRDGRTPRGCWIVGSSREPTLDDAAVQTIAREAALAAGGEARAVEEWVARYVTGATGTDKDLTALKARVEAVEAAAGIPPRRVFYLSLPPTVFPAMIEALGRAGLSRAHAGHDDGTDGGWSRLVIEKPFGHDLASARTLNALIHRSFDERQVYRIDHYLGKETVQNLLVFRFANAVFESLWNRDHVESVMITVAESLGIEGRAGYYEGAGQLRDMVQSHLSQLFSLVAMEVPSRLDADAVRAEKLKVLRAVRALVPDDAVFGQYEPGRIDGKDVRGYREEPGVRPDSRTETFAALTLHVENWRWQGVPFHLRTGKRMLRRLTEIEIKFRRAPVWMFRSRHGPTEEEGGIGALHRNTLLLTLQPDEGFSLYIDIKAPGDPFRIHRLPLHFDYKEVFPALPEAYQTLLLDVLQGDQTLFVHADEVEASWQLYAPLLDGRRAVYPYPAGTWGPIEAARISSR
jgi:glucose-6-phosphate 1-dehydrogenase